MHFDVKYIENTCLALGHVKVVVFSHFRWFEKENKACNAKMHFLAKVVKVV